MNQFKKLIILVLLILIIQLKKTDYNTKISETENKVNDHDHAKYITTQEFSKLTSGNFASGLAQANFASKNDIANFVKKTYFADKLKNLNKKATSGKTKHVLVENELNELSEKFKLLSAKHYTFFIGKVYFTSNDGSQNMFVYQPEFNAL